LRKPAANPIASGRHHQKKAEPRVLSRSLIADT
jgi:hypothetical protein